MEKERVQVKKARAQAKKKRVQMKKSRVLARKIRAQMLPACAQAKKALRPIEKVHRNWQPIRLVPSIPPLEYFALVRGTSSADYLSSP